MKTPQEKNDHRKFAVKSKEETKMLLFCEVQAPFEERNTKLIHSLYAVCFTVSLSQSTLGSPHFRSRQSWFLNIGHLSSALPLNFYKNS